ncbi:30S ribosomal protein S17 [candidate division KSB1 bacterium]|nr:30S ribosomal protein S17 [bacterium]OQX59222.1 MAG: 30S ribosomal protein S17 [candidate division KSB1 bacterium 4484_219]RKY80096.1 MAG: 30S ribosomal protein S17 [candidate division KSB1 bacterium]HDI51264.1 30S ribosomal protein S17 [Bacteroidota bacterium]RKY81128.1 MAG: 30S ribosomal protein S17 [candidate division KSB1 bacterium]
METGVRGKRKIIQGYVVSDKMDKTRVIAVERYIQHPLYKKYVKRTKKFMIHDPSNESQMGDLVKVIEVRPLSRRKRWQLLEVVEKAK